MQERARPTVSIIIKAFNEERHIATAIESALAALKGLDGEVILADGASTDATVAIAQSYPIRIVRLQDAQERSCGAGAQLGFQYSNGQYLFLMDGDMRLHADFLPAAVCFLEENEKIAGVGGAVVERELGNLEYAQRARRFDPDRQPGPVTRLNGCGLYRRSAIEAVGYLTDRNLHGAEELELAARLQAAGWMLARINCLAVDHYGHGGSPFRLLLRRIATRNAFAPGEIVRASIGRPQFWFVVRNDRILLLCAMLAGWWLSIAALALLGSGLTAATTALALLAFPFVAMALRWRSLRAAVYSIVVWHVLALCFLPGFLRARAQPARWMASSIIEPDEVPGEFSTHRAKL
jgi:glycosyltransferase involved in cell wall biosynthesis